MRKIWIAALGAMLVLLPMTARAQEKPAIPLQRFSEMRERMMEALKLTDDQKKEVDKLRFDFEKQLIAEGAKLATTWVEYRQLLSADVPDRGAIEKKFGEMTDGAGRLHALFLDHWFSVNKLLNADQQKTWKKALEFPTGLLGASHSHREPEDMPGEKKEK